MIRSISSIVASATFGHSYADSTTPSAPPLPHTSIEVDLLTKISAKKYLNSYRNGDSADSDNDIVSFEGGRPPGVPNKLRIVTIDLPEFRTKFTQSCKVDYARVFADGIARDKSTTVGKKTHKTVQKSLAQSLLRCGSDVEILELSISKMITDDQTTFKEELSLRLAGRSGGYAALLTKSSWLSKMFTRSDFTWKAQNASTIPLCVVANGESLNLVEGSLLHLINVCKANNIMLFVVNDSRSYKSDTNCDLEQVVGDIRLAIKTKIIRNAIKIKEGDAYDRGKEAGRRIEKIVSSTQAEIEQRKWKGRGGRGLLRELKKRGVGSGVLRELAGLILVDIEREEQGGRPRTIPNNNNDNPQQGPD